nr:hypothetical protein [Gemmatimonadota bacterium]
MNASSVDQPRHRHPNPEPVACREVRARDGDAPHEPVEDRHANRLTIDLHRDDTFGSPRVELMMIAPNATRLLHDGDGAADLQIPDAEAGEYGRFLMPHLRFDGACADAESTVGLGSSAEASIVVDGAPTPSALVEPTLPVAFRFASTLP